MCLDFKGIISSKNNLSSLEDNIYRVQGAESLVYCVIHLLVGVNFAYSL